MQIARQFPNAIKYTDEEITVEKYHAIKDSLLSHNKEVDICYNCYFDITKYHAFSGAGMHGYLGIKSLLKKKSQGKHPDINVSTLIRKKMNNQNAEIYEQEISVDKVDYESDNLAPMDRSVSQSSKSISKLFLFKKKTANPFSINLKRSQSIQSSVKELSLAKDDDEDELKSQSGLLKTGFQNSSQTTKLPVFPSFYHARNNSQMKKSGFFKLKSNLTQ